MLFYFIATVFAVADVGTLFLLSHWIGISLTLLVVAFSTVTGLLACRKLLTKLADQHTALRESHGANPPQQVKLYMGLEIILILLSLFLFIFPGLLSDLLAYLMLIPVFREKVREVVKWLQDRDIVFTGKQREEMPSDNQD